MIAYLKRSEIVSPVDVATDMTHGFFESNLLLEINKSLNYQYRSHAVDLTM